MERQVRMQSHGKNCVGKHKQRKWYNGDAHDMQDVNGSQDPPEKISKTAKGDKKLSFFPKEHWKDKHDSTATGVGDRVAFQTACRPIDFKKTVSVLCNEKRTAIHELGFGPLHLFRSSKLHWPLCQMLVDNFDLANCSIHIHGRSLSINHLDFERIMGVQDGGSPVDLDGSLDDPDIVEITRKVFGDKEMSVDVLKNLIHNTKKADDTFRISFSLYTLAILLCPSTPDKVDPRFLLPLRDPTAVCKNNWATLCFTKLVEGLRLFKKDRSQYLGGCLVFLQLFYLDSIVSTPPTLYKNMVPAAAWGKRESKRVYKQVEDSGGFNSPEVYVSKRFSWVRMELPSSSVDLSTGFNTKVTKDMTEVKSEWCAINRNLNSISSTVSRMEHEIACLHSTFGRMETSLAILKSEGLNGIVSDAMKALISRVPNLFSRGKDEGLSHSQEYSVPEQLSKSVQVYGIANELRSITPAVVVSRMCIPECSREQEKETVGLPQESKSVQEDGTMNKERAEIFSINRELSDNDVMILKYLFSDVRKSEDRFSSHQVAKYGEFSISRWDICCLSPMCKLSSEVINISAAYLYERQSDCWFMPTFYGERAEEYGEEMPMDGWRSTMLGRFKGRLFACRKIFIPIYDGVEDHWFLLVVNITETEAEIWDSHRDSVTDNRRRECAIAAIVQLHKVFADDLRRFPDLYMKLSSIKLIYPKVDPFVVNIFDSGIYVLRNMQHYRKSWYYGFHSADQRVRLALELVNNPKNEVIHVVRSAISTHQQLHETANCNSPASDLKDGVNKDPLLTSCNIAFRPRRARR